MDKLKELEKRMDRIKILMDCTDMNIEEMLAAYADTSVDCSDCPIKCTFNTSCFDEWLKYLNGGD